ncbi:MAG: TolC family protein [Komarekiella atlantica HA4396-MV6]|jgi:outer membrane protein TolC|nr:TolC family protein [Komarekiella atlantica HA4396-MV6]
MNFILFFVHSTWITVAFAFLIPTLARSADATTPPQTQKSPSVTGTGSVQVPNSLNPNPNLLQFPTKSDEVRIQATVPISLAQALELARRNNRELQVALLELERSRSALRESQAALFPTLGVNSSVTNSGNNLITSPPAGSNSSSSSTSFNGSAQLNYDLYTSGSRQARIRAAEEQLRVNELDVENRSLEIRLNVTTEYYDLQQADEQVRINGSAVENAQASLRDTQAREQAGVGTRFDVLQAQVNLANAQQTLTNSLSEQEIARRRLATRLSLAQSVNISAADPVQLAGLWQPTVEQTIIQAFQNRPELQQFLAQRNISEQQRRQALSSLGPQISLASSYSLLDRFDDGVGVTDGYSVGVQANQNLFDGGAARASAAQSRANIAIAENQFANQRDQIRFDVEQFYSQLQANRDNVQTSSVALNQARESLNLARLRFQAGVGTQTEVIAAENDLTRAEGNRVTAILNYNRALANLQRSVTSRNSP